MKRRQITLADGRYLIFYTFEDEEGGVSFSADVKVEDAEEAPPKPVAEEEHRV